VKHFQQTHHLAATGAVGQHTWDWLRHPKQELTAFREAHPTFHVGDHSQKIESAEKNLKKLGYDPGAVDGTMDAKTADAIKKFRADESSKVKSGALTSSLRKALDEAVGKLQHNPYHSRVKPSKEHRRLDSATASAAAATAADGQLGIGEGAKSRAVKNVQAHLAAAGFDPGHVSGRFDERTAGALKAFQLKSGLVPTGRVDTGTWRKLKESYLYAKNGTSPAQTIGERSGAVRHSEKVLRELGYKHVEADGRFDASTARAVRAFQKKHHLKVDGEIGARTAKAMKSSLGVHATAAMRRLARNSHAVAASMGGTHSLGLCATGVSRAIARTFGISVSGNGNQIDENLPRSKFKQVHMSLAKALKIPGLVLTWEHTSTALGSRFGHTAITWGDGHTSSSDFIEFNTLAGSSGRSGLKIFMPR
jgi:peptidoglycan hydrolase-like protein with peptidoglycan-binding domain